MDIGSVKVSETSILKVRHPLNGSETDITIELYGADTKHYRSAVNSLAKSRSKNKSSATMEEIEDAALTLLADCTASWNNIEENKKQLPFSKENAKRIYSELPWLRKQVDSFIGDDINFLDEQPSV